MKNVIQILLCGSLACFAMIFSPRTSAITGIYDLYGGEHLEITRTPFNPLPGEGIKQLINRLGVTYNEIETKIDLIPGIFDDYLEIELLEAHCPIILFSSDFGPTGTIIDEPGYYIFCDDIEWDAEDSSSLITTVTSHVTIDLNYHTILQTSTAIGTTGITIDPDVHDVTIKQGTIADFDQYGIYVDSTSGFGCYHLRIDQVRIENTEDHGIYLQGNIDSEIHDCWVSNCSVTRAGNNSLELEYCRDIYFTDCDFNNNDAYGARADECTKLYFLNCHFNDNEAIGANIEDSDTCLFDNCTFNNNSSEIADVYGIFYDEGKGVVIKNCCAIGNTSIGSNYCFGMDLQGGGIVINCLALNNSSENQICRGIRSFFEKISGCRAIGNKATGSGNCYGLEVAGSNQFMYECKALSNFADINQGASGIGIYITGSSVIVQNCSSFSNGTDGIQNDTANTIITGCVAGNNLTNFGGIYPPHFAKRNQLGNHWQIGEQENISLETAGIDEVGCVVYLNAEAIEPGGYTITKPGHYILCDDVTFNNDSVTAFSIECNFVTLDLNGKSISGTLDTVISVTPEVHDIAIMNGSFSGFDNYGIFVDEDCHHINIEYINMSNSSCNSAIKFNGSSGKEIHDCSINWCRITELSLLTQTGRAPLIHFIYCSDIGVSNSSFNFNTSVDDASILYQENSNKCRYIDCHFNNNSTSSGNELDIVNLNQSNSNLFERCLFNNNYSDDDGSIMYAVGTGTIIRECTINNNTTVLGFNGIFINGDGNYIERCLIGKNISFGPSGRALRGIQVSSSSEGNIISSCCIQANDAPNGANCYGIQIIGDNNAILGCKTLYNSASSGALAIGIAIDSSADKTTVDQCTCLGNTDSGIYNDGTNSIIVGNDAGNNFTDFSGSPGAYAVSYCMTGSTVPQPAYRYDNAEFTL